MATHSKPPAGDARALAARVLAEVLEHGRSLGDVLPPAQATLDDVRNSALLQELCYGTLRWYFRLNAVLQRLMSRPLKARDGDVRGLLLVGLYQIDQLSLPQRVAVHETVQAVRALHKDWASGLVNAVLRNFQRHRDSLLQAACADPEALFAHPAWLIERLQADWPDDWAAILAANNARPPMTVRVNVRRMTRDEYLDLLAEQDIPAYALSHTDQAVCLQRPLPVTALPGFERGDVSVQDAAAQLAAGLLDLQPGVRVLDACAAPGGKAAHLLEREPGVQLTALDIDESRLDRVRENLARLSLAADVRRGDARLPTEWWDEQPYDRMLLDVPCSGSGVIRRHPDIRVLRRATDIDALVKRQADILDALWPLLASGGILLYCTCSVLKAENSRQLEKFLARHDDAADVAIDAAWGHGCTRGRQVFPGENQMDGFYYACIRKIS